MATIAVGTSSRIAAQDHSQGTQNPAVHHGPAKDRARIVLAQALSQMDGAHLKATLVEVDYGPGEASPPHSHPCPVIGYVLEGAIRTKVEGAPEAVYKVGETFYEAANRVHEISANASFTEPARLLAYFICDHDAPLSSAVPESESKGGK
jgi:quercetin dioxygenase-like cupin family protein